MEVTIDLEKVGYVVGKYGTKVVKYITAAQLAQSGFRKVSKIASKHKIDSSNSAIVTENLFNCLKYID